MPDTEGKKVPAEPGPVHVVDDTDNGPEPYPVAQLMVQVVPPMKVEAVQSLPDVSVKVYPVTGDSLGHWVQPVKEEGSEVPAGVVEPS